MKSEFLKRFIAISCQLTIESGFISADSRLEQEHSLAGFLVLIYPSVLGSKYVSSIQKECRFEIVCMPHIPRG